MSLVVCRPAWLICAQNCAPWTLAAAVQRRKASIIAPSGAVTTVHEVPAAGVPAPPVAARGERRDLPALPADSPPIDRSKVRRALSDEERPVADVMLAFRAACVVDTPGGLVALENLYRRYRHWAGARAAEPATFRSLFPDVTGVRLADIGGLCHAHDVALRVGAELKVA